MSDTPSLGKVPGMDKLNNFMTNKEKWVGKITTFIGIGVVGWVLYQVLPFLNKLLTWSMEAIGRMMVIGIMLVVALILWQIFTSKTFWAQVWYIRTILFRKITKLIVRVNPIETINAYVNEFLGEQLATVQGAVAKVLGAKEELKKDIDDYQNQVNEWVEQANALKNRFYNSNHNQWVDEGGTNEDHHGEFIILSNQITMYNGQLKKSRARLEKLELYCAIMQKMAKALNFQIRNIRFFAEMLEKDYEQTQKMAIATEAASSVLGGNIKTDIYNEAVDYVKGQIADFTGKVDEFVNRAPEFLNAPDLENMAGEDRLMRALQEFEMSADQMYIKAQENSKALESGDLRSAIRQRTPMSVTTGKTSSDRPSGKITRKTQGTYGGLG